jgi:subtilisin family serine protease
MIRGAWRFVLAVTILLRAAGGVTHAADDLDDFRDAGAAVCVWKPGQLENGVKAVEALGFEVVYRSPFQLGLTCEWKGKLTNDALSDLKKVEGLRYVEPAPLITLEDGPAGTAPLNGEALNAYNWAGAMTCVCKKGKKEEALKLAKDLKLTVVSNPSSQPAFVCEWKPPLPRKVLEGLMKSEALEYVEPAPKPELIRAKRGRMIEFEQGKPSIRNSGDRLGCYPQDPSLKRLWGMENINAPQAWCYAKTSDVVVAVIDSGIDFGHPDLQANMLINPRRGKLIKGLADDFHGANFVDLKAGLPTGDVMDGSGHGTHVAGTIGAVGNNKTGIVGVNWRVKMMAVKVFDNKGKIAKGRSLALADALAYARKAKAKVINMSLGMNARAKVLGEQITECEKERILVVCSAGNKNTNNDVKPQFPAAFPNSNILAVAAIDSNDKLARFSNFGRKTVHLAAPGKDIFSTVPVSRGSFARKSGTSMATPHVSGAAALAWGQKKYAGLDHRQMKELLLSNVRKLGPLSGACATGGTLNIAFLNPEPPQDDPQPPPVPPPPYLRCPPPWIFCPFPARPMSSFRVRGGAEGSALAPFPRLRSSHVTARGDRGDFVLDGPTGQASLTSLSGPAAEPFCSALVSRRCEGEPE